MQVDSARSSETSTKKAGRLSEADAAKIALSGSFVERAALGAKALYDLIRDPEDTTRVFVLGLLVSRRAYPVLLARITTDDRGARLLRERPAIDSAHVDFARLRALPATTLGGAYARYLDAKQLDPDLFQPPPGLPEVPSYIAQRMRQVHDLWHVLTGYDTDVPGEIALQAFTWAQTDAPSAALVTIGGLLRFGVSDRGLFVRVVDAYRRGRRAEFLAPIWLEEMWERPLDEVRAELGIVPAMAA
jgi:ubiquinone biosynthesis protein COQ4